MARQRVADQEYEMTERIYSQRQAEELRARQIEEDSIANALHGQIRVETIDEKTRGILRENDHEYRELKSKLQLALVTQTRDNQRCEAAMRRQRAEEERLEAEEHRMRNSLMQDQQRTAEEEAKHREAFLMKEVIQEQMGDKDRRRQLIEAAQAERDRQQIDVVVQRVRAEDAAQLKNIGDVKFRNALKWKNSSSTSPNEGRRETG
jgi:hypothetical protein